jgi:CO/xanthine dehydrogenase Mo-binding subunit
MIRIITENAPDSGPSCASRNITAITKLVEKCCLAIRKQRFHDPLPITVRRSIKPQNGSLYGGFLSAPEGSIMDINGFTKFGQACAVVEVSVDLIECAPKIRGVWLGVDGGKIVSSNRAKRNITRSAIQALGWAFTEYIEYIKGSLPKNHYENFSIPSPVDIPPIHIEFIPGDNEPKGIGELPFTCIPAAFLQAVSQAMDHSFKSIPLKRKEIWEMLRFRNDRYSAQGPVK